MSEATLAPAIFLPRSPIARAVTLVVVVVPFVATIFAIVKLWEREVVPIDLAMLVVLYILGGIGITVGFHRFATHRSFETHPVIEVILFALGSMAIEGGVITWTADHWKHHKFADKPGDPHSPLEGFVHAHLGWFFGHNRGVRRVSLERREKKKIA